MESQKVRKFSPAWAAAFFFAIIWLLITGMPFYYLIMTSLKSLGDFLSGTLFTFPKKLMFGNYTQVIKGGFLHYLLNSVILELVSLSILLLLSAFAAYPLARMKFKLNKPIFAIIVASMSVPIYITIIPMFKMAWDFGTFDTVWALVPPNIAFNLPMSVFILESFMEGIPKSIEEAAEIDGCGKFSTFFRIIFPLSTSGLATLGIYNGVVIWNEFTFAMTLTQSKPSRTLPLAVWQFQGEYSSNTPVIMAVLVLSALPIILLYVFGQDKLVKGMMAGAVKG